jgi:hypothetical protein
LISPAGLTIRSATVRGDIFGEGVIRMGHAAGAHTPVTASIYEHSQQSLGTIETKGID